MLASVRNELGWSQERAANEAQIAKKSLSRYEICPESASPEKILSLSKAYQNEELLEWYCTDICAIGREHHCKFVVNDLASSVLSLLKELGDIGAYQSKLISITCDGHIDTSEVSDAQAIMGEIEHLERALHALKSKFAREFDNLEKGKSPARQCRRSVS